MNKILKNDILLKNFKFLKFIIFTLLFLFFNVILSGILVNVKLDLTADRLFTLSNNTKDIIKELNEPIKIQLFFSNALSKELAQIRDYEKRVRELLYNYVNISNGNISLEIIDPKPFTDQEDLANVYGVQGLQINEEGERFYFGAVVSNSVDDTTVIPFFDLGRERFLEYDLTKTIYNLANTEKPTIGLISGLPFIGGVSNSQEGPQYQEPFYLHTRILEFFKVQDLFEKNGKIIKDKISFSEKINFLSYLFYYKTQIKVWVGLYPFIILNIILNNYGFVQVINKKMKLQRPHKNKLLYEKMRKNKYSKIINKINHFLK